jgi:hypothetical protein
VHKRYYRDFTKLQKGQQKKSRVVETGNRQKSMKEIFEKTDKTGGERYLLLDVGGTDGMIRGVGMAIPGRLIMSTESAACRD